MIILNKLVYYGLEDENNTSTNCNSSWSCRPWKTSSIFHNKSSSIKFLSHYLLVEDQKGDNCYSLVFRGCYIRGCIAPSCFIKKEGVRMYKF